MGHGIARSYSLKVSIERCRDTLFCARCAGTHQLKLSQEVGQKVTLLRWPLDARNDPALLESMQSVLMKIGMLKAPIPVRQLYDETLLEEVLKEKR